MINFNNEQKIIVTGASSGIGESVAILLNELGATVIGIGRDLPRLNAMKEKCKFPENVFLEQKDLTEDVENLPQYVKSLKEKYGKFYGLAYCAGIGELNPLQSLDLERAKSIFDINYYAPLFLSKGFADRRNNIGKGASIVFIASISALKSDKGHIAYAGSKAALIASAKSMARELVASGIRVNCVSPADVRTSMTEQKALDEEHKYPLGYGEVKDVSGMMAYLLSDEAKWITAQNYVIDCGGVL